MLSRQHLSSEFLASVERLAMASTGVRFGELPLAWREAILRRASLEEPRGWPAGGPWEETRAAFLERFPQCEVCGKQASHVHHRHYRTVGREAPGDLASLCKLHHQEVHSEEGWLSACLRGLWQGPWAPPLHRGGVRKSSNGRTYEIPRSPLPELESVLDAGAIHPVPI